MFSFPPQTSFLFKCWFKCFGTFMHFFLLFDFQHSTSTETLEAVLLPSLSFTTRRTENKIMNIWCLWLPPSFLLVQLPSSPLIMLGLFQKWLIFMQACVWPTSLWTKYTKTYLKKSCVCDYLLGFFFSCETGGWTNEPHLQSLTSTTDAAVREREEGGSHQWALQVLQIYKKNAPHYHHSLLNQSTCNKKYPCFQAKADPLKAPLPGLTGPSNCALCNDLPC